MGVHVELLQDETFESYSVRPSPFFKMKRENGIIEVPVHTNDGEALFCLEIHRAFARMFRAVGADRPLLHAASARGASADDKRGGPALEESFHARVRHAFVTIGSGHETFEHRR